MTPTTTRRIKRETSTAGRSTDAVLPVLMSAPRVVRVGLDLTIGAQGPVGILTPCRWGFAPHETLWAPRLSVRGPGAFRTGMLWISGIAAPFGCHAHGSAWACLNHAHAEPWAWHPRR